MQDFMKDRYGVDELTYLLGLSGMVLALIGSLTDVKALSWLAIAIILIALARAFSKNLAARDKENAAFKGFAAKVPGLNTLVEKLSSGAMGAGAYRGSTGAGTGTTGRSSRPKPTQADVERAKRTAKKMWSERKTSKFLKCPTCGQILSVPKGKGKIRVTCPKCRTKVETKS